MRLTYLTAFFAFLSMWLRAIPAVGEESGALKTAHEVAWTPFRDDAPPQEVDITATVTFIDTTGTVFLEDESGSTFLRATTARSHQFALGQQLHIRGLHSKGLYVHGVTYDQVDIVGQMQLPPAPALTWQQMTGGAYHYQRATVRGIVRSVEMTGEHTATVHLAFEDQFLELRVAQTQDDSSSLNHLIDAKIQVEGLIAGAINDRGQLLLPYIQVANEHYFTILQPAPEDPFSVPVTTLRQLETKPLHLGSQHRHRLQGSVYKTKIFDGFILRTEEGSTLIAQSLPSDIGEGDHIEVVAFPRMGTYSLYFENAEIRKVEGYSAPQPEVIQESALKSGATDFTWVQVRGEVLSIPSNHGGFEVKVGSTLIQVNAPPERVNSLTIGTSLQLTGVLKITETYFQNYRARPAAFLLHVSEHDEIIVLASGPWLTTTHLKWGLAILTISASGFALWVLLLRRQVRNQLRLLQSKLEKEMILEERTRIAREFHDTLEQELAGTSIRLDTIKAIIGESKATPLIDDVRSLLVKIQHETRDFVFNLREHFDDQTPLTSKLEGLIAHLQGTTSIEIRFSSETTDSVIPSVAQHHLMRITREAVHNAIKYARPSLIQVNLGITPHDLNLSIRDDGSGFSSNLRELPSGHYGLRGLQERAKKIGAELSIQSKAKHGTCVSLKVPLPIAGLPLQDANA